MIERETLFKYVLNPLINLSVSMINSMSIYLDLLG